MQVFGQKKAPILKLFQKIICPGRGGGGFPLDEQQDIKYVLSSRRSKLKTSLHGVKSSTKKSIVKGRHTRYTVV